jgi:hypothetical protein
MAETSPASGERGCSYLAPNPASPPAVEITDLWVNPNTSNLLARVTVTIPRWGLTLCGCPVVRTKAGSHFVMPPSAAMVRDGVALRDDTGKVRYAPAVIFTKDAGRRFSDAVIAALHRSRPELFGG